MWIMVPLVFLKCRLWESGCWRGQSRKHSVWCFLCILRTFPSKLWHSNKFCCSQKSIASFSAPATIPMYLLPTKNNRKGLFVCWWDTCIQESGLCVCGMQDTFLTDLRFVAGLTHGENREERGELGIISVAGPWLLPAPHCSVGALPAGGNVV